MKFLFCLSIILCSCTGELSPKDGLSLLAPGQGKPQEGPLKEGDHLLTALHQDQEKIFLLQQGQIIHLSTVPQGERVSSLELVGEQLLVTTQQYDAAKGQKPNLYALPYSAQQNYPQSLLPAALSTDFSNALILGSNDSFVILSAQQPQIGQELLILNHRLEKITSADLFQGALSSYPSNGAFLGEDFYFTGFSDNSGEELWVSRNGQRPEIVKDLVAQHNGSAPSEFKVSNNNDLLLFTSRFLAAGTTSNAPIQLLSLKAGETTPKLLASSAQSSAQGANPQFVTLIDPMVLSNCDQGSAGRELCYLEDIASAGQWNYVDLYSGAGSSMPQFFTLVQKKIYLRATTASAGTEIMSFDPQNKQVAIHDLVPGSSSSNPEELFYFNQMLHFSAQFDPSDQRKKLYSFNGQKTAEVSYQQSPLFYAKIWK